jgi:GNAT superfamily N-acetyltransferase
MDVIVRSLRESDLDAADRICRVAFGTFLGLPDPARMFGDADYVRTRFRSEPEGALAVDVDGELAGSNLATRWGSVGFFGPLSVRTDLWDRGVAKRLLEPTMALFDRWGIRHAGLFTFAASGKHVGLYQSFGFWPRFLTPIVARRPEPRPADWKEFSALDPAAREGVLGECREAADAVHQGLDPRREILAVAGQRLGDTLLVGGDRLEAFAICHSGAGSEAGSGTVYVKLGLARPGPRAAESYERLLDACEAYAAARDAGTLVLGVNAAREDALRRVRARGFRTVLQGVAMHRPNEPGYSRADAYVIDDWR